MQHLHRVVTNLFAKRKENQIEDVFFATAEKIENINDFSLHNRTTITDIIQSADV
jgi:hypothetical protein